MMDADDLELFRAAVLGSVTGRSGAHFDAAVDEVGWFDALADDARAAIGVLFEAKGTLCASSSSLGRLVANSLGRSGAVALLPNLGSSVAPGHTDSNTFEGTTTAPLAASLVVVASTPDGSVAIDVATDSLTGHQIAGLDPDAALVGISGSINISAATPVDWSVAVDVARIALAHELTGAASAMLEMARTHALGREQFGQPISGFQAVRHRLADALIAIETARAAIDLAWEAPSSTTAAMAKAVAGRSARTVMKNAQQVLAGLGFTEEHPLHHFVRRVISLDATFGSSQQLTHELGDEIIRTGTLPPMLSL